MSPALRKLGVALFASQFVLVDLLLRGRDALGSVPAGAGALASIALWALVAELARSRRSRIVAALCASTGVVVTLLVFRFYHAPLDAQIVASAVFAFRDVRPVLGRALPQIAVGIALVGLLEAGLLGALRAARTPRPARGAGRKRVLPLASVVVVALVLGPSPRAATPDVRALHALTGLVPRSTTSAAAAPPLLPLPSVRETLPSVLFVLTESVRAEDYTAARSARTRRVLQPRADAMVDLPTMRSVSSYTAVSVSALLTGLTQEGPRSEILAAPTVFGVARAVRGAGSGERLHVGYVAGQSETVFEAKNPRAWFDTFVTVETLLGHDIEDDSDYTRLPIDRTVVDRFERELGATPSPHFTMLHLASTHAPYFVDPDDAPSKPYAHVVTWSGLGELHAAYENAIVAQDAVVARAASAFVAHAGARPWVIVFTSDHGEAFGEHGAIHHGQNLYDEQIRVPGWVASGNGALTGGQLAALRRNATAGVTHLDLLPTIIDVLGVTDAIGLEGARARLAGRSLLGATEARTSLPVTNCTGMFPCPIDTWGVLGRDRKLVAQPWDHAFVCTSLDDVAKRESLVPPGDAGCAALLASARSWFPRLPSGEPCR